MATARELLAQADALMRRNRLREAARIAPPAEVADFPVLTEVVGVAAGPATQPAVIDIEQAIDVAELETEAAVAAATEAALARQAAAAAADTAPAAPVADEDAPAPRSDPLVAVEGPEPTSAVAAIDRFTHWRTDVDIPIPADALSLAPATQAVAPHAHGPDTDTFPVLTEAVDEPQRLAASGAADEQAVSWEEFDEQIAAVDMVAPEAEAVAPMPAETAVDVPPAAAPQADVPQDNAQEGDATQDAATVGESPREAAAPATAAALVAAVAASDSATPSAPTPASAPASAASAESTAADNARWTALAEEIRMQVLQRIDIFTDTGLQEQLAARLQPIVDRASADLVATINQQVGALLRAYVAEAIEREIDRWREDAG